jgi:hypothetical protein
MTARTTKASTKRTKAKAQNGQRKQVVTYTDEIGDLICQRLREGESLLSVCSSDDMPSESAVRQWAADPTHHFSAKYARAREVGWLRVGDEVLALADGLEHGKDRHDPNIIARDRLRYEARRWMLSKVLPKIYGDRLEVDAKAGLVVVETPAAIKALLEALPDLGVLSLEGSATAAIAPPVVEGS